MKLGATPKQIAILVGLLLLALVLQFTGGDDRPPSDSQRRAQSPTPAVSGAAGPRAPITPVSAKSAAPKQQKGTRQATQEFKPILRPRRLEDRIDPTTIDPTLRTDLLARLGNVPIQGGSRPLFDFSAAPPPKAPDPGKIIPAKPVTMAKPVGAPVIAPQPGGVPPAPVKPQAPPIPLKFYGFTGARAGVKRAFFLENEDVFVANEGETVKKRYKVVRINLNSVVMEDTEFKQQQTLPLVEISQ
ncbi:MAG: hypothetical protein JNM66_33500 [Bryobacterales bacterium]|nr:hypothetical protein [Bryobacterales bacterium]